MRLTGACDDVAGTLSVNSRGFRFFGLGGPAGAWIDPAPGLQGPGTQFTETPLCQDSCRL